MPRKKFIPQNQFPYHITNRCNNKEWFDVPLPRVWRLFCDQILDSAEQFQVWVHSFVLMSNHFHMMLLTPNQNLDSFLRHFLTEVARKLKRESMRENHIFGGRTRQTILDSAYSVAYVYKYIYRNPVRAGLCSNIQDYPFSTFTSLLKNEDTFPISEGVDDLWSLLPKQIDKRIQWLNLPTPKEQEKLISNALRKSRFKFSKSNADRRKLELLSRSYHIVPFHDPYLLGPIGFPHRKRILSGDIEK